MTFETDQAEGIERHGWPWSLIPTQYRVLGKPPKDILAAAKPAIGKPEDRKALPIITLMGPVGCGKTTEACRLAAWVACGIERPRRLGVAYHLALSLAWTDREDIEALQAGFPILVLDDLSAGLSAAGLVHALEIIEDRIAWQRRTIVTTSLTLEAIAEAETKAHGREIGLASRLGGGALVRMPDRDRRIG